MLILYISLYFSCSFKEHLVNPNFVFDRRRAKFAGRDLLLIHLVFISFSVTKPL